MFPLRVFQNRTLSVIANTYRPQHFHSVIVPRCDYVQSNSGRANGTYQVCRSLRVCLYADWKCQKTMNWSLLNPLCKLHTSMEMQSIIISIIIKALKDRWWTWDNAMRNRKSKTLTIRKAMGNLIFPVSLLLGNNFPPK